MLRAIYLIIFGNTSSASGSETPTLNAVSTYFFVAGQY